MAYARLSTILLLSSLVSLVGACSFDSVGLGTEGSAGGNSGPLGSTSEAESTTTGAPTTDATMGSESMGSEPTTTGVDPTTTTTDPSTTTDSTNTTDSTSTDPTTTGVEPTTSEGESTTTTGEPICGDGIVEEGEECDDGPDNGPEQACTPECTVNVCGDGFLHKGVEECDDGNLIDGDGCSSSCETEGRRVFVTKNRWKGNLGGIAGADEKCGKAAADADLPGQWMAWISTDSDATSPSVRFTGATDVPFVRTNGVKIADDWDDLLSTPLAERLNLDEEGNGVGDEDNVWSNVNADDGKSATFYDCFDWGSQSGAAWGRKGNAQQTDGRWTENGSRNCNQTARLYCFQQ